MSDPMEQSVSMPAQLKQKLMNSWELMGKKYPVIRTMEPIRGDSAKEAFLKSIDGLKSAEEIAALHS